MKNLNNHYQNLLKNQSKKEMILQAALEKADKLKEEKGNLIENLKKLESEKKELNSLLNDKGELQNKKSGEIIKIEDSNVIENDKFKEELIISNKQEINKLKNENCIVKEKNDKLLNTIDIKNKEINDIQISLKNLLKKEMLMQAAIEKTEKLKDDKNNLLEEIKRLEKVIEQYKIHIDEMNKLIEKINNEKNSFFVESDNSIKLNNIEVLKTKYENSISELLAKIKDLESSINFNNENSQKIAKENRILNLKLNELTLDREKIYEEIKQKDTIKSMD